MTSFEFVDFVIHFREEKRTFLSNSFCKFVTKSSNLKIEDTIISFWNFLTFKGWSGKVRVGHAQSPMGWSDEVLGVGSDEEEIELDYTSSESIPAMAMPENRPQSLSVQSEEPTEPWQISLHRNTWDRSPNRSFIRNFP